MNIMWDFLRPSRLKVWIAIVLWASYWLVGKVDSFAVFPIVSAFYPNYFAKLMETMQPQAENFATLLSPDSIAVMNITDAVHVVVAAVVGYLAACLVMFLVKHGKAI